MSKALNILAALLLAILPVAAPCSAHGFTLLCTCSGYEVAESETDAAEPENHPTCPCCASADSATSPDHQPAPAKPCGGGDKRSVPDATYSAEVVPQVELVSTVVAETNRDSGLGRFWLAHVGEIRRVKEAQALPPPSTAPPWGLILAATARILV